MITKERLEELIEQGATIYELFMDKEILKVELNKNYYIMLDKVYENKLGKLPLRPYWLFDLFETKEEAVWHKEFGCIERTERLELPTWEEIFPYKDILYDGIYDLWWKKCLCYGIEIVAIITNGDFEDGVIRVNDTYFKGITKENYTLACRKVRELFLGEKK